MFDRIHASELVPPTRLSSTFGPLRAMAEADAMAWWTQWGLSGGGSPHPWTWLNDETRLAHIRTRMALLTDLTRPDTRDAWVRWGQGRGRGLHPDDWGLLRDSPVDLREALEAESR